MVRRWPTAPSLLLALTGALFVAVAVPAATSSARSLHEPEPQQTVAAANPEARAGEYIGSEGCRRCHEPEYDSWRKTLHVQMTKPIAEARVLGDFRLGTRLQDGERAYDMETRDGRYFISIAKGGRPAERFQVDYTLGARRFQGYLSTLPDGRIYVLPVFWHSETNRWVDYKEITPIPDDPQHDLRQIWNVTCVNCHATNLARNYDGAANRFATTWTEMGIGCEACHGPGRAHVDDPEHLRIFTMKKVPPRQVFDTCGYCHGNKNNVFFGFKAGDRYEDFALPFLISQPIPPNDPQGDFWPDGRPSRFNRPQALTLTGCFQKGAATCTSCHRMHGSENNHSLKVAIDAPGGGHTRESDALCTQCHVAPSAGGGRGAQADTTTAYPDEAAGVTSSRRATPIDPAAHTHHAPASSGSRCISCHMSDVNWRLITRRLDHTFQAPVPEMTAKYGAPNACTTCHEDRSPEWAASRLDAWYGNRERRQAIVAMADTIYRAGTGDAAVLPELARLAVDRRQGALIRASAAEFVGQLLAATNGSGAAAPTIAPSETAAPPNATSSPAPSALSLVNALIGASADPEPMVRITAVRALGLLRDARVPPALAAHLTDPVRVVRVSAAEALFNLGITTLEGAAGAALARAQDEWTEALRTFEDEANDRVTLGWLEAARGRNDSAAGQLTAALKLDPSNARAHVYLGVLAARAGRYAEALQHFTTAKSVTPTYPNIDRLIDEARKRR